MKKLWILPLAAIMFSCGASTEQAPVAEPDEEIAPVEKVVEKVVADSTMEEAAADSTMEEAAADSTMEEAAEEHEGHDH
jgi:hypothetical protein